MKKIIYLSIIFSLLFGNLSPALAEFNPNFIISDQELTDKEALHFEQIQEFLESRDSYLATYVDPSNRISAAQAIYYAANNHRINPKYILVLLQKEQSLITDKTPSQDQLDWATGYGICDNCKKDDPKLQKYRGFTAQVDWGAGAIRYYYDNPNNFKYQVGETYTIDNQKVTMVNNATRAFYTYTPHIHGNKNFYKIWQNWFGSSLLDGTLVQDSESGGIYLIKDGQRLPFLSKAAFLSRYSSFDKVVQASPSDLEKYTVGTSIKYPNYSLLQVKSGGIYLLDNDTLRPIVSKEAFRLLGFNPEEITPVETNDIFFYKIGMPITEKSAYPTGAILIDESTDETYYVQDGTKKPILANELIDIYYSNKTAFPVTSEEIENYTTKDPVKLRDGELVRTPEDPTVYIITDGKKRPFASAEAFHGLGYKFSNVVFIPKTILDLHPLGELVFDKMTEGVED